MTDGSVPVRPRSERRALWVVPVNDIGGVARHVLDALGAGIPGWRVTLLAPPGPLADAASDQGLEVRTGTFGPAHGLLASLRTLLATTAEVAPVVVHSHLSYADIVCALLPSRSVKRVSTEHGIARDDLVYHSTARAARAMAQVHRLRLRRLDAQLAVSHATAQAIRQKWRPPRRLAIDIIPNGIDPADTPSPRPQEGLRFAALSRLAPEKGLDDLVRAFAKVHAGHPDARLDLAGTGPLEGELRQLIASCDLGDVVRLIGQVDGIEGLGPVDVVAQLSVWENCSYTLLDAVRAGCGVVATDVGGNPEVLPDRCLVPVGDTDLVAARLVEQATDLDRRPELPAGWPTVGEMCAAIGAAYDRVAA